MSALRLVHDADADERRLAAAAAVEIDRHRVGALIIGAAPLSAWRPRDRQLAQIVDTIAVVVASAGTEHADAGLSFDVLRELDPDAPWASILDRLMTDYDARAAQIACVHARQLAERYVQERRAALDAAHDDLAVALERARDASAGLRRALDLWSQTLAATDEVSR